MGDKLKKAQEAKAKELRMKSTWNSITASNTRNTNTAKSKKAADLAKGQARMAEMLERQSTDSNQ